MGKLKTYLEHKQKNYSLYLTKKPEKTAKFKILLEKELSNEIPVKSSMYEIQVNIKDEVVSRLGSSLHVNQGDM